MSGYVQQVDLEPIKESTVYVKKEMVHFVKKDEFMARLNMYQIEFNEKLNQKATTKQLKTVVKTVDENMDSIKSNFISRINSV